MLRINKYILIFSLMLIAMYGATATFVQSEYFGTLVTKELKKRILSDTALRLSFKNINVSLLPPRMVIHQIDLSYEGDFGSLQSKIDRAQTTLSLWSLLTNKVSIDELVLAEGVVQVELSTELEQESTQGDAFNFSHIVERVNEELPVKIEELSLENLDLYLEDYGDLRVVHARAQFFESFITQELLIERINISEDFTKEIPWLQKVDGLFAALDLSDSELNIRQIKAWKGLDYLEGEGSYLIETRQVQGDLVYHGGLDVLSYYLEQSIRETVDGHGKIGVRFGGELTSLEGIAQIELKDVSSDFVVLDELEMTLNLSEGVLSLTQLDAERRGGTVKLTEDFRLYDLKNKRPILSDVHGEISQVEVRDGLYVIRDVFDDVSGSLNGKLTVQFDQKNNDIVFRAHRDFMLTNFALKGGRENILENERLNIGESIVVLQDDQKVSLQSTIHFKDSYLRAGGEIGDGRIDIDVVSTKLALEDVGSISGVELKGYGDWYIHIGEELDDVNFHISGNLKEIELLGFKLDQATTRLNLKLQPLSIQLESLEGSSYQGKLAITGEVLFSEEESFSLNYRLSDMSYRASKEALSPVWNLIPAQPEGLEFIYQAEGRVWGGFDADQINATTKLQTPSVRWKSEDFEKFNFELSYIEKKLNVKNIELANGSSGLKGEIFFDTETNYLEYDASWKEGPLSDFESYLNLNLGLVGLVSAEFYGSGTLEELSTKATLRLKDSFVEGIQAEDSIVELYNTSGDVYFNADVLGILKSESYIDLDSKKKSLVQIDLSAPDLKLPLGILAKNNVTDSSIDGEIVGGISSEFLLSDWQNANGSIRLDKFKIAKRNKELILEEPSTLSMEKGSINRQRLRLTSEQDHYLLFSLNGNIASTMNARARFNLPANYLEFLSDEIALAQGKIIGSITFLKSAGEKWRSRSSLQGEEIVLQFGFLPSLIENAQFKISSNDSDVLLESFKGGYGKGDLELNGSLRLNFPYPEVQLDLLVDNSYIPVMNRSGIVIAGGTSITGQKPPYLVQGVVNVLFGEVYEELNEFQSGSDNLKNIQRFLPKNDQANDGLLSLDVTVRAQRPVLVRNNMLELYLEGGGKLRGSSTNPLFEGTIRSVSGQSKFKFKGHEFLLSRGNIELDRLYYRDGAHLDFSGISTINDYRIRLDVTGRTRNMTVSLSSEPPLSQEDIFSLLTLGVTSDISEALDESERQSVATVGIGTLLADQFRLNEGLDSSFGLRLSVLPEFAPEETSLLQGKSAVSEAGSSRFRSATRVRLQKKLTERVDLSVSSTVGGSLDQKQEMNVNLKINNRWSLEGVYELRTTDDEGIETTDSIGADLKYRWSF